MVLHEQMASTCAQLHLHECCAHVPATHANGVCMPALACCLWKWGCTCARLLACHFCSLVANSSWPMAQRLGTSALLNIKGNPQVSLRVLKSIGTIEHGKLFQLFSVTISESPISIFWISSIAQNFISDYKINQLDFSATVCCNPHLETADVAKMP